MGNILGTAKDSEPQAQYVILLENWSLGQFAQKFKVEGWDDPRYWHEMTDNDLNEMGFKKGHIVKFKNQLNEWRKKNNLNQMNENEQKRNDENEEQKQPELGLYELTRKLTDLGFTVEISLNAATKYTGDIDAAINWIHQQQQNNVDVKPVHDHKEIKKDEETDISKDFLSNISVILDNDHNIFENNPFALAITNDNDKKLNILFQQTAMFDNKIDLIFNKKYYIHLIGAIFNRGYLLKGSKNTSNIKKYLVKSINEDPDLKDEIVKQRVVNIIINLLQNTSPDRNVTFSSKSTSEDTQLIQLCFHWLSVVLSLPPNPFSKLFHDPQQCKNEYLPAMPEGESNRFLKVMAGHGVWLCPNDHVYFVGNCTVTNGKGKCQQCGAPIGNKVGAKSHTAATGNRRIGKIDKNGKIVADNPYSGATEGMVKYDAAKLAPKGYVLIEGNDNSCRVLDDVTVRIVRWMLNAIIFLHASETNTSSADIFTSIKKDKITIKLKNIVQRYIIEIGHKLNDLSFEDVIYLMHQICDNFYTQFQIKFGDKGLLQLTDAKKRVYFEAFLVDSCIKPATSNTSKMLLEVKTKLFIDDKTVNESKPRHKIKNRGIFVKNMLGSTLLLPEIQMNDTIQNVKCKIQEKNGVPTEDQRIIYCGRQLEDGRTINAYGIQKGSTLYMVRRLRGS